MALEKTNYSAITAVEEVAEKLFQGDNWYVKKGFTKQGSPRTMTAVSFSSQLRDPRAQRLQLKDQIKGKDFY